MALLSAVENTVKVELDWKSFVNNYVSIDARPVHQSNADAIVASFRLEHGLIICYFQQINYNGSVFCYQLLLFFRNAPTLSFEMGFRFPRKRGSPACFRGISSVLDHNFVIPLSS